MTLDRRGLLVGSAALAVGACVEHHESAISLYALLDVSPGSFKGLDKAVRTLRDMLGLLHAQDSFAVAEIGICGPSDETILRFTVPDRPKERQRMMAAYSQRLAGYAAKAAAKSYNDIASALNDAARQLAERPATERTIVLFSGLDVSLPADCRRENALAPELRGVEVIAAGSDPRDNDRRVESWRHLVEAAGGRWRVVADAGGVVAFLRDRGP